MNKRQFFQAKFASFTMPIGSHRLSAMLHPKSLPGWKSIAGPGGAASNFWSHWATRELVATGEMHRIGRLGNLGLIWSVCNWSNNYKWATGAVIASVQSNIDAAVRSSKTLINKSNMLPWYNKFIMMLPPDKKSKTAWYITGHIYHDDHCPCSYSHIHTQTLSNIIIPSPVHIKHCANSLLPSWFLRYVQY